MGLSGAKNRSKLSHDPNNTHWSKSTTTFGHKILTAQGWTPGSYLGAEDAKHAGHYTAANASHIRIQLREENLGIGAKIGKGNAETFGLSMFSGLLGRLNGKDEGELQKQEEARRDVELRSWQANKYGFMNFVRGGLLVGDKIEEGKDAGKVGADAAETKVQVTRKRKAEEDAEAGMEVVAVKEKKKKRKTDRDAELESPADDAATPSEKPKRKKRSRENADEASKELVTEAGPESSAKLEKARRKAEKLRKAAEKAAKEPTASSVEAIKARLKAEKQVRKVERRIRRAEKASKKASKETKSKEFEKCEPSIQISANSSESEGTSTPPVVARPIPANLGRHAVRHRYIQQKRMASMDPKALREIFMLKAAG